MVAADMRTAHSPDKSQADPILRELSEVLARGYLRLLTAQRQAELAPPARAPEQDSRNPQIRLDVAGPTKRQLDRRLGP